jgi:hypothetical protein
MLPDLILGNGKNRGKLAAEFFNITDLRPPNTYITQPGFHGENSSVTVQYKAAFSCSWYGGAGLVWMPAQHKYAVTDQQSQAKNAKTNKQDHKTLVL